MSLVYVLVSRNVLIVKGDSVEDFEISLGDKAAYALGYNAIGIGSFSFVVPDYIDLDKLEVTKYDNIKSKQDVFSSIVSDLSGIEYEVNQSNPYKVFTEGGNCQAISLLLHKTLVENGIDADLVLDKGISHMYVKAELEDKSYNVDLVKGSVTLRD